MGSDPYRYYPAGGEHPHDPARAGFVGKRRKVGRGWPDPDGNRAERRAHARAERRRQQVRDDVAEHHQPGHVTNRD